MARPSLPSLPMEILEKIVGFHGTKGAGQAPTTLLSCLSTSRQFRICALRHLCAEVFIPLDWPRRLKRLHDCIISGSFGRFIKSVFISCGSRPRYSSLQFDEDIILPLLHILSSQVNVQKLTLRGYRRSGYGIGSVFIWTNLPGRTRNLLLSLTQAPTLEHLSFDSFLDIHPEDVLARHTSGMVTRQILPSSSNIIVENTLNIRSMTLNNCCLQICHLPNLRKFDTTRTLTTEYDSGWKIIKDCCNTLETIWIRDEEKYGLSAPIQFPQDVSINMFPRLEEFVYSYHGCAGDQMRHILLKVLPFFKISEVVPELKVLTLDLSWDAGIFGGNADEFWVGRSNSIASDRGWNELDVVLAKGCFPALTKVCISLSFSIAILAFQEIDIEDVLIERVAHKEALKQEVEDELSKSFSASLKASIPLEINVHMAF